MSSKTSCVIFWVVINPLSAGDATFSGHLQSSQTPLHFPHVYDRSLDFDVIAFIKVNIGPRVLSLRAHSPLPGYNRKVLAPDPAARNLPYGATRSRVLETRDTVSVLMR